MGFYPTKSQFFSLRAYLAKNQWLLREQLWWRRGRVVACGAADTSLSPGEGFKFSTINSSLFLRHSAHYVKRDYLTISLPIGNYLSLLPLELRASIWAAKLKLYFCYFYPCRDRRQLKTGVLQFKSCSASQ